MNFDEYWKNYIEDYINFIDCVYKHKINKNVWEEGYSEARDAWDFQQEKIDNYLAIFKKICNYNDGKNEYNFSNLNDYERQNKSYDSWKEIRNEINNIFNT
jgi:hypothetical protein